MAQQQSGANNVSFETDSLQFDRLRHCTWCNALPYNFPLYLCNGQEFLNNKIIIHLIEAHFNIVLFYICITSSKKGYTNYDNSNNYYKPVADIATCNIKIHTGDAPVTGLSLCKCLHLSSCHYQGPRIRQGYNT